MDLELYKDVRVRKAMNLAIDRESICETMASGQVPATVFVPPGFVDNNGKDFFEESGMYGLLTNDSKIAEAQALLADAGYPNGEGFPEFTIMYDTSEGHQQAAELVREILKTNLGMKVKLENQELAVLQDTRRQGDFDALYESQDILMVELPITSVYHYTEVMLVNPKLQGWDRLVLGTIDSSLAEIVE